MTEAVAPLPLAVLPLPLEMPLEMSLEMPLEMSLAVLSLATFLAPRKLKLH